MAIFEDLSANFLVEIFQHDDFEKDSPGKSVLDVLPYQLLAVEVLLGAGLDDCGESGIDVHPGAGVLDRVLFPFNTRGRESVKILALASGNSTDRSGPFPPLLANKIDNLVRQGP